MIYFAMHQSFFTVTIACSQTCSTFSNNENESVHNMGQRISTRMDKCDVMKMIYGSD